MTTIEWANEIAYLLVLCNKTHFKFRFELPMNSRQLSVISPNRLETVTNTLLYLSWMKVTKSAYLLRLKTKQKKSHISFSFHLVEALWILWRGTNFLSNRSILPERTQKRLILSKNQNRCFDSNPMLLKFISSVSFLDWYLEFSGLGTINSMSSASGNEVKTGMGIASLCGTGRRA